MYLVFLESLAYPVISRSELLEFGQQFQDHPNIRDVLPLFWHFSLVISSCIRNEQLLPVPRLIVSSGSQLGSQLAQQP